ncbi:unnamed protein product [Closterium sp. NIES-54]
MVIESVTDAFEHRGSKQFLKQLTFQHPLITTDIAQVPTHTRYVHQERQRRGHGRPIAQPRLSTPSSSPPPHSLPHSQISAWANNLLKAVLGLGAASPFKPLNGVTPQCLALENAVVLRQRDTFNASDEPCASLLHQFTNHSLPPPLCSPPPYPLLFFPFSPVPSSPHTHTGISVGQQSSQGSAGARGNTALQATERGHTAVVLQHLPLKFTNSTPPPSFPLSLLFYSDPSLPSHFPSLTRLPSHPPTQISAWASSLLKPRSVA